MFLFNGCGLEEYTDQKLAPLMYLANNVSCTNEKHRIDIQGGST